MMLQNPILAEAFGTLKGRAYSTYPQPDQHAMAIARQLSGNVNEINGNLLVVIQALVDVMLVVDTQDAEITRLRREVRNISQGIV